MRGGYDRRATGSARVRLRGRFNVSPGPHGVLREEGLLVADFKAITHLKEAASGLTPSLIIADSWGESYTSIDAEERAQIAELASIAPLILMSGRARVDHVTP